MRYPIFWILRLMARGLRLKTFDLMGKYTMEASFRCKIHIDSANQTHSLPFGRIFLDNGKTQQYLHLDGSASRTLKLYRSNIILLPMKRSKLPEHSIRKGYRHRHIRKTCPCNIYPLKPYFYIEKGVCRGIHIFLIFAPKHRLWVLVRTASLRRF